MELLDALAIVRDLANENVLEEWQAKDNECEEERERQLGAVSAVDDLIEMLREAEPFPCGHPKNPDDNICSSLYCNEED